MFFPIIKPIFRIAARIISFIIFALTLLSAYGGRINPEYVAFPSILVLGLPYLAIASMLITVAWFCVGRFITAAIGVLALVAAWGPISTAVPLHFNAHPENESNTFKLLTYNIIHGWDLQFPEDKSENRSFEYIIGSGADIVSLQELYSISNNEIPNFTTELRDSLFKVYPYHAGTSGCDLKVLSKYPIKLIDEFHPDGGRSGSFALYNIQMPFGNLNLINMHLNSYHLTDKEKKIIKELTSMKSAKEGVAEMKGPIRRKLSDSFRERSVCAAHLAELVKATDGPLVVNGDFNDVPESYAYRLMRSAGLKDAYVETSFGPMITYNQHAFWFHLDQFFYKGNLKPLRVKKHGLKSSDHYPVWAVFEYISHKNRK